MKQCVNNHKFGKLDYIQQTPASQKLRAVRNAPAKVMSITSGQPPKHVFAVLSAN
jgi:hypothetical protein